MTKIKNLPLEEKLKIPIRKLPFSKEVKTEFERKSVYGLEKLYYKVLGLIEPTGEMRVCLPGFTCEAYSESIRLLSALKLMPKDNRISEKYLSSKLLSYANKES